MKKLLFILLFPLICFSQSTTINNIGTPNIHTQNRGGVGGDSIVLLPVRNHNNIFGALRLTGRVQINSITLKPEYNNGSAWNYFASESFVNAGLSLKLNNPNGLTSQYLDGLGVPKNFPAVADNSPTNELQSLSLSGNLLSITNGNSLTLPVANNYTAGNGIVITGTAPNLTISVVQPTVTVVTSKVLNSNFTISTTKPAIVSYSVTCTVTNPLLIGTSTATAYLEYSLNSGTTWLTPSQSGNSSGVGVTVAIQLTNTQTGTLTGVIPTNALVRIRTATTGTASVNYITGTEITY